MQDLRVTSGRDRVTGASAVALSGDASLVARAATGDADAFDLLIRPRLDRLFRMSVAILRSEANARDAVQEACVHAWRELPRLRDRDRFVRVALPDRRQRLPVPATSRASRSRA